MEVTFERLVGEIAEGIAISDPRQPDNPLVYVNPAFCRLTGYTEEEVLGQNCRFLQGPDTDQRELDKLRTAIRTNSPCVVELLNYRKDGSRFWNNLSISPVFDNGNRVIYLTGIQMDITRRRELEEKQRAFVGNLAHELKTPIAAITGLTDTLERQSGLPEETYRSIISSMQKQSERLGETVESILDLSRLEYADHATAKQLIDLRDVVEESVDATADLARTNGITLQCDLPKRPVSVLGDTWSLVMLVNNLLSNAVKFSKPEGTVLIRIASGKHSCQLLVIDDGPGIEPDQHKLIFDRFYRVDESRNRQNGGSGLGLSIVNEIARLHNGYVKVDSNPGEGSTFIVTLPVYSGGVR